MTRDEQILKAGEEIASNPFELEGFIEGAEWADEHPKPIRKDAQGDDLPEIDREVVVIDKRGKVSYGHRPDPDGWDGRNIITNKVTHHAPQTYDKGGWNIPDVVWWLDLDLPNLEDLV